MFNEVGKKLYFLPRQDNNKMTDYPLPNNGSYDATTDRIRFYLWC